MTPDIEVSGLRLAYGDAVALDGLSFGLTGGKIYGLLGRNGAGKTSLLSVLAAFRKAGGGVVRVGGEQVWENPSATRRICLVREAGEASAIGTVEDAFYFAEALRPGWDAAYAERLVEMFELPKRKNVSELSLGKRSALGVTIGLASRAPLTMFDESYLGMDAPSRYAFYDELLRDFIANPRTVIMSTHLIEEVSSLFEEVLIIEGGRLLLHEESDALRARGASVTGPEDEVERFVAGLTVLGDKRLGRTRSAMVYGELDDGRREAAVRAGLDIGPIALQDLFIHLTGQRGAAVGGALEGGPE
ncbi:ABC transporter ATP-binding protein [Spongiactinospora sp. TRM90649]|uniref:ATP-binding cassette domain-containing protein n=1 Tax=Spongiactinospora sp. TRM90649 TaxID=3031114 RepID=UPI0023F705CE|nr:ABC transporter ATP-binding protein [Spongiactinospora sp. TRM90649]MDF5757980.1 ABC transporter ATP-binding protein [Spongiactinospora sp. TRM90649]